MTVTREPADRADAEVDPDDAGDVSAEELAALEAAAEQARGDARRAAQAVRLARRARSRSAAPAPEAELDEVPAERVTLAKATPTAAVAAPAVVDDSEDEVVDDLEPAVVDDDPDAADSDEDVDEEAADDETDEAGARTRRRPRRVTLFATLFALLAVVFVVVATVVYVNARDTRATSPAAARDAALLAARQDIVVISTLDYTDIDGGVQRWLAATTDPLRSSLTQITDADKQAIAASKSMTTASVLAAAVTQVDAVKGTATVLASVQTDVTPQTGDATVKRTRYSLSMVRVGDVWKLSTVQQIPVTVT